MRNTKIKKGFKALHSASDYC